jgi:hypothetical protein
MEDVDQLLGPDGAMETFIEARREGKISVHCFSAHFSSGRHGSDG